MISVKKKVKQNYLIVSNLHIVSVLHLPKLLFQRFVGSSQTLDLDSLGLQLPPELVHFLPAGADGLVTTVSLLGKICKLALVPLLGGLQVL